MTRMRVVTAAAAFSAGLILAAAHEPDRGASAEAAEPPALVPLVLLGHPALRDLQRSQADDHQGPETCLIGVDRCSPDPCVQYVQRRGERVPRRPPQGCDPYPDATPRMIPVR